MLVLESNLNDKKYPKEALKCCFKKKYKGFKRKKIVLPNPRSYGYGDDLDSTEQEVSL